MKAIRYIATILLIAAGAGHIFLYIQNPADVNSAGVLIFGVIYFVIGILMLLKIKYSSILGIIFPLIGTIVGLVFFDLAESTPLFKILGITDAVIIILCSILLGASRKKAE